MIAFDSVQPCISYFMKNRRDIKTVMMLENISISIDIFVRLPGLLWLGEIQTYVTY